MPRRRLSREHIYLVDDSAGRWNIRKVDLSSSSNFGNNTEPQPLPPTVVGLSGPVGFPQFFASAFGTKILAMLPSGFSGMLFPRGCFPIVDVSLNSLIFGPRPEPVISDPIYIPVDDDSLFVLGSGTFQMLCFPEQGEEDMGWTWMKLSNPPFETQHVTSYALHPDQRNILVSTQSGNIAATFSFDTEVSFRWRKLGDWRLPFTGRGHFDSKLDSFVGLSTDPDTLGHLYSCAAISSDDINGGMCQAPMQRLSKETLFSEDVAKHNIDATQEKLFSKEKHLGATLVYMKNSFCLVQGVGVKEKCVDDEGADDELEEKGALHSSRHMFRLTKFSLEYDSNGDMRFDGIRQVQYYEVPEASIAVLKNPVAFYL